MDEVATIEYLREQVRSVSALAAEARTERDAERRRAQRLQNAANEAIILCDRSRPTMAGAVLRAALAEAPAPKQPGSESRAGVLARRVLRADDYRESDKAWHWAVDLARLVVEGDL